jgi:hypothetical protein
MRINLALAGREWDAGARSWTAADAARYGVAVGVEAYGPESAFLPTFATALWDLWSGPARGIVDQPSVRQVEQSLLVYGPLPAASTARTIARVIGFRDLGPDALVLAEATSIETGTGRLLAWMRTGFRVPGAGGFGGEDEAEPDWAVPDRAPDYVAAHATRPDQGQMFRMWAEYSLRYAGGGDTTLPVQCLFGIAGRALLHTVASSDPAAFGGLSARFVAPVPAGAELVFHVWDEGDTALFEARVDDLVVIDRGRFTRKPL